MLGQSRTQIRAILLDPIVSVRSVQNGNVRFKRKWRWCRRNWLEREGTEAAQVNGEPEVWRAESAFHISTVTLQTCPTDFWCKLSPVLWIADSAHRVSGVATNSSRSRASSPVRERLEFAMAKSRGTPLHLPFRSLSRNTEIASAISCASAMLA